MADPRNLHKNIEDANKHTPAGFDSAVNESVCTKDSLGAVVWELRSNFSASAYGSNLNRFSASTEVNTSAPHTNWVNVLNDVTTSLAAGDYELTLSYGWNHNATNSDFESKIIFDSVILGDIFGAGATHKQEPKDSAGSGGGSGSSQQYAFTKVFELNGVLAGVKDIAFEFRSDDASDLSTVWDVYVKLIKVA